ncbi:hypothetical protein WICPIJ_001217 [Wickerhamomyces pijperi]|uniref:E3 ubiquitin-protein ligase PEP5 n=1 Tax=Wickerhamomyces pijperi TaxID=599730 RepID=A0A9P8QE84_WICPI|nr:hypothetical protein WICPIJ_001217 [Wickerhamomyces pijperi]
MSWSQFQFFDIIPLRDPQLSSATPLYSDPSLTSVCTTTGYLILANTANQIKLVNPQYEVTREFIAYEKEYRITYMSEVISGFFTTIAERQGYPSSLKLWSLEKILFRDLKKLNHTSYSSQVTVKNGNNTYPITSFTFNKAFNILALGFANGTVVIVRGDIMRDRGSSQTVAYKDSALDPITGLRFMKDNDYDPLLYVTTTSKVLTVPSTQTYKPGSETVLDFEQGADVNCMTLSPLNQLIVAIDEGLAYYEPNGTKYTLTIPKIPNKRRIAQLSPQYILIETSNTSDSSALVYTGHVETTRIVVIDILNKLISFSHTVPASIRDVLKTWKDGNDRADYLLTVDGTLYQIESKSLREQVNIVLEREAYPIAIQLAEKSEPSLSATEILNIKKAYADHLYQRGDTSEAVNWYIAVIGLGDTTEVIRKYKDGKEVANLSKYLEALLAQGLSTKDHITLLISTFCKMKDLEKFQLFVSQWSPDSNLEVDMAVVLELCKDTTGFLDSASTLAMKLDQPSLAFEILFRDLEDYFKAFSYLRTLPVFEVLRILIDFGRPLLEHLPLKTTLLMIEVFTGKYKSIEISDQPANGTSSSNQEAESPVLLQSYQSFVNFMTSTADTAVSLATNLSTGSSSEDVDEIDTTPTYQPPRPRVIFPSFVQNTDEFVIFLEACLESSSQDIPQKDKDDILTTLFESYLNLAEKSTTKPVKQQWQNKALSLVEMNDLERNTVLLIADVFDFKSEIEEVIYQGVKGYASDLMRSAIAQGDLNKVQSTLKAYGDEETELYVLALKYYISIDTVYEQVEERELKRVLDIVHERRILPPLEIIQTLSLTTVAPLSLIKPYVIKILQSTDTEIEQTSQIVTTYKSNLGKLEAKLTELKESPTQSEPSKVCTHCHNTILNNKTQFLCGHIYHQYCLTTDSACPLCTPQRENITNIKEKQKDMSERYEVLKLGLDEINGDGRFKYITEWFGKGGMSGIAYNIVEQ